MATSQDLKSFLYVEAVFVSAAYAVYDPDVLLSLHKLIGQISLFACVGCQDGYRVDVVEYGPMVYS